MRRLVLVLLFIFSICSNATAQNDSTQIRIKSDSSTTLIKKKKSFAKDPKRATLLSAVFPGSGQIYNGKYWKLPILYGGAFTLGYFINFNHQQYILTRNSYLLVKADPNNYKSGYSAEQLVRLREYWRRNRDMLIIISGFTYLLNIADAAVDAHFSTFDVSDDLSMKVRPSLLMAGNQPVFGLGLALNFK